MKEEKIYDFAIIGAGASGIHLALAMLNDPHFDNQKIILIEKAAKDPIDKTWCFWEEGAGRWDQHTSHQWTRGTFVTNTFQRSLILDPYRYKMLESPAFYKYARSQIYPSDRIEWVKDEVKEIGNSGPLKITGVNATYAAFQVFDSRIDPEFFNTKHQYSTVLQHFKGWMIETPTPVFDPEVFVMMDFRIKWKDSTSFTYVLPISKHRALIEYTFFSPEVVKDEVYDEMLVNYIRKILKVKEFEIIRSEKGIIPMTDFPFHHQNRPGLVKIGTAGSWVKPSSGYSFKNCEKYAAKTIKNIKLDRRPERGLWRWRFRKYDGLLLDILQTKNHLGEKIFTELYSHNPTPRILRFLDEESTITEDLKLISSLTAGPFLHALWRYLRK